ncbi:replication protein P [Pseudomonas sp. F1_0610]|uniref:replication protein P n=1 Tax=Pseudomonas sp. F1_0610 TaxID=3114284 RepID=UPI0039C12008
MSAQRVTSNALVSSVQLPAKPKRVVYSFNKPTLLELPDDKKLQVKQAIDYLIDELKALCPAWKQAWTANTDMRVVKRNWAEALVSEGITSKSQIDLGLRLLRNEQSPFLPSISQFVTLCQPTPENLGLPSVDDAYKQAFAVSHPAANFSHCHPASYHAACEVGLYVMTRYSEQTSRERFAKAYKETLSKIWRGEAIRALPDSETKTAIIKATPEVANKALTDMRAMLGIKRKRILS